MHLNKIYDITPIMNFDSRITIVFEQMHKTASFGVLKNTADVITGLFEQFPKSVIVNVVADEIDAELNEALNTTVACVYERTIELVPSEETTTPVGITDTPVTTGTDRRVHR